MAAPTNGNTAEWLSRGARGARPFEDDLIGVLLMVRAEPAPFTDEQIQVVQTFADQAAMTIAKARLVNAVERQRTELLRFVSPQVAELFSSEQGEQLLAGHRAYISSLYCDLRGSTAFAETAAPDAWSDRIRRPLRPWRGRAGFEPRRAAQQSRGGRTGPGQPARTRRDRRRSRRSPVGEIELKGFGRPVVAYEVRGLR